MRGRAIVVASAIALGASAASGMGSCTSTATIAPSGVDEPPILHIVSPANGACIEVPDTTSAFVPVTVDLGGSFYLRPPGVSCANTYNCGYLQLFVNDAPNNTSATATINALIGNFGDRYGTFTLTVELVWDLNDGGGQDQFDAQVYFDGGAPHVPVVSPDGSIADNGPTGFYQQTVTVRTAASCKDAGGTGGAAPTDGGGTGGASPGDGGTGGAPADGGTGGAPPADAGTGGSAPVDAGGGGGAGGGPSDAGASG